MLQETLRFDNRHFRKTLDKLACNVVDNQSSDDDVVSCQVTVVIKHPSIIKCGISLADVSH